MTKERKTRERDQFRDELLAILAASRELPADHDEVLTDLILDRVEHPMPAATLRASAPCRRNVRRADPAPLLITAAIATVLSLVGALMSHASVADFLTLWFFVVCVVCGVMQIGLYLGTARISPPA